MINSLTKHNSLFRTLKLPTSVVRVSVVVRELINKPVMSPTLNLVLLLPGNASFLPLYPKPGALVYTLPSVNDS